MVRQFRQFRQFRQPGLNKGGGCTHYLGCMTSAEMICVCPAVSPPAGKAGRDGRDGTEWTEWDGVDGVDGVGRNGRGRADGTEGRRDGVDGVSLSRIRPNVCLPQCLRCVCE